METARAKGPWSRGGPSTVRGLDPRDQPYLGSGRPFGGLHYEQKTFQGKGKSLGCNAAMADGSARSLRDSIDPRVLEAMTTIAGREEVDYSDY
jgi:hypothetical protein